VNLYHSIQVLPLPWPRLNVKDHRGDECYCADNRPEHSEQYDPPRRALLLPVVPDADDDIADRAHEEADERGLGGPPAPVRSERHIEKGVRWFCLASSGDVHSQLSGAHRRRGTGPSAPRAADETVTLRPTVR
jgi:hypothetical protein